MGSKDDAAQPQREIEVSKDREDRGMLLERQLKGDKVAE
jgi:hypothetical protein